MKVQGIIKQIGTEEVFGTNNFRVRKFVVETEEQYPQEIELQMTQNMCDELNSYKEGDSVVCDINLRGRRWTNKEGKDIFFNTIQCWRINRNDQGGRQNSAVDNYKASNAPAQEGEEDNPPF